MSSIISTGLAPVATKDSELYLYFQDNNNTILEAYSKDGKNWSVSSAIVAKDARGDGAPLTAYYVENGADKARKSTIHVFYLNQQSRLSEAMKILPDGEWLAISTSDISGGQTPDQTSQITGATYTGGNWNPDGDQWLYYSTSVGNNTKITEARRAPNRPWNVETVLPQTALSLPGTRLSAYLVPNGIDLHLQDHERNIRKWENRNHTWADKGTVIPKDNVAVNTPIATTSYSGTQHVIVVDNAEQHTIQDYVNGKPSPIERFYPGSSLGAICPPAVKPILFYKSLNPVGVIKTKVFNGSSWEDGATVA